MYRVFAIVGGGLILAACSSTSSWLDSLKPEPLTETIQLESDPSGAEARTSTGQTCRTPCSLAVPAANPFTVTFTLAGYTPTSEQVELVAQGDGTSRLRPNPVLVELTPGPTPPPAKKPPVRRKPAGKKPAAKRTSTAAAPAVAEQSAPAPAPAPAAASPASPWPAPQAR